MNIMQPRASQKGAFFGVIDHRRIATQVNPPTGEVFVFAERDVIHPATGVATRRFFS